MTIRVQIDGTTYQHLNTVEISGEKNTEVGAFFYDLKCNELKFGKEVHDLFIGLPVCEKLDVTIQQDCGDGNGYVTIFNGYTSKLRCKFEPKKCIVTLKIVANNKTDCLLRTWEEEHNILETITKQDTNYFSAEGLEFLALQDESVPTDWSSYGTFSDYNIINTTIPQLEFNGNVQANIGIDILARRKVTTYSVEGVATPPQTDTSHNTTGWHLYEDNTATSGTAVYVSAVDAGTYNLLTSQTSSIYDAYYLERCTSPCTAPYPPSGNYFAGDEFFNLSAGDTYMLWVDIDHLKTVLPNGRLLWGVLAYLNSKQACSAPSFVSTFLNSVTNPITGNANEYLDLILYQKSDIVTPTATEKATIAKLSLKQLLSSLCALLNLGWYIDNSDRIVIEHLSTLKASASVSNNLLLLEGGKYVANKEVFSFKDDTIPHTENHSYPITPNSISFTGMPIKYDHECRGGDNVLFAVTDLETEVGRIVGNTNEGTDGVVLVARGDVFNGSQATYSASPITGTWEPNMTLSTAYIQDNLFKNAGRLLPQGVMNGNSETFTNTKRIKVEENVVFPVCCFSSFDPTGLIKTNVGDGEIDSFTYNTKSRTIQCKLNHEI